MKLAFIVFDGITWLDLIGLYEPVSRLRSMGYLPDLEWDFCAYETPVKDPLGLEMVPTRIKNDLSGYDAILVPGGMGTRKRMKDESFLEWMRTAEKVPYKISVCTGSLLLGAAGFLKDKVATTHFDEYDTLRPFCKRVSDQRVEKDDKTITAGAVSASIDLGLFLCRIWGGDDCDQAIRYRMDYQG